MLFPLIILLLFTLFISSVVIRFDNRVKDNGPVHFVEMSTYVDAYAKMCKKKKHGSFAAVIVEVVLQNRRIEYWFDHSVPFFELQFFSHSFPNPSTHDSSDAASTPPR